MRAYSDPSRESDPHALPDVEVFYITADEATERNQHEALSPDWFAGWYWWACFPGCLPDSEPNGPFATEAEALEDAQQDCEG